tara:strand:+ start:170 stop:295 length:126 start_codon:yes stop_codon:yes gene_type:complete
MIIKKFMYIIVTADVKVCEDPAVLDQIKAIFHCLGKIYRHY